MAYTPLNIFMSCSTCKRTGMEYTLLEELPQEPVDAQIMPTSIFGVVFRRVYVGCKYCQTAVACILSDRLLWANKTEAWGERNGITVRISL